MRPSMVNKILKFILTYFGNHFVSASETPFDWFHSYCSINSCMLTALALVHSNHAIRNKIDSMQVRIIFRLQI